MFKNVDGSLVVCLLVVSLPLVVSLFLVVSLPCSRSGTTPSPTASRLAFEIGDDTFSDAGAMVRLKTLRNTATGEHASVNVNWGGGVEELVLLSGRHSRLRNVLWTHGRNATAVKLNADWRGRMLIPNGNRIGGATYEFNESAFHLPVNDASSHQSIRSRMPLPMATQPVPVCSMSSGSYVLVQDPLPTVQILLAPDVDPTDHPYRNRRRSRD